MKILKKLYFLGLFFLHFATLTAQQISNSQIPPHRIVSLSPTVTEQVFLLGQGDKIVACTEYCTRPPEATQKEKIGSILNVNVEKIISLSPDIVFASSLTKPQTINKLQSLNIKVKVFVSPRTFEELLEQLIELGTIIGEEEKAKKICSKTRLRIEKIKKLFNEDSYKPKVAIQIGAKPMYLAGNDSFVGDFIIYAGAVNVLGDKKSGVYCKEMIIAENPDVIIITTMGFAGESEKEEWMRYNSLSAAKTNKIILFDSSSICSPNPVELPYTLAKIAKIIHPQKAIEIENALKENANTQ